MDEWVNEHSFSRREPLEELLLVQKTILQSWSKVYLLLSDEDVDNGHEKVKGDKN